ncbi:MAG: DUF4276 family protein [Ktedonobacteraceae bacterium]
MNMLVMGLYVEGPTDDRFLRVIIQRTAEKILLQHDCHEVVVLEPISIQKHPDIFHRSESILQAARDTYGFHSLVVHADADGPTRDDAYRYRFEPGNKLVQASTENVCKDIVPIIPVRMVEAWMLADMGQLYKALGTEISKQKSDLLSKAKHVESYHDPKSVIDKIIQRTYPEKPQNWRRIRGQLYADLAPMIRLSRLNEIPAYQQFVYDLTYTLKAINFIY